MLYYNGSSSWSYYQVISTKYDFIGTIEKTRTKHYLGGSTNIIEQEYSYDHVGRLTTVTHKLNSNTKQILSTQTYNDLGVLKQKIVGGSSSTVCAQIMDYSYNIRGWLTSINDVNSSSTGKKLFSMELLYESTSGLPSTTTAQYNGNISGVKWRTPANSNIESPSTIQTYGYVYDGLNRLQTAKYLESNRTEYYDVAIGNYDLNGNIGTITRKHKGSLIDNLTLGYSGNSLLYVNDNYADDNMGFTEVSASLSEYSYDSNGNMTKDDNKDLSSISYNVLNLPSKLIGGTTNINYIYDGSGRKLVKSVTGGSSPTYYYGALVFDGSSLDYVLHDEGVVELGSSSTGSYSYHLKDHLGNVRMVVDAGGYAEQQNDYYPFGMEFASAGNSSNKYKYNGKEAQDDYIGGKKLGWLDFHARFYDPTLGRSGTQDPHAENYCGFSPYSMFANNPILFIDPDGQDVYMYFYAGSGEKSKEDEAMFWASALTRANDMLKNGKIGEGDLHVIRSISDLGKLGEAVDAVVNEFSPKFGKTAEFGLWSHGALDGPIGPEPTTGNNALGTQMTSEGWGDINFNWKNDGFGSQAMFFGCRTAATENNAGESITSWAQIISQNANMKNTEVWGQTKKSWPSLYPDASHTTSNMNNGIHGGITYMVGSTKGFFKRLDRKMGKISYGYPMGVYQNGKFLRTSYQYWRK